MAAKETELDTKHTKIDQFWFGMCLHAPERLGFGKLVSS